MPHAQRVNKQAVFFILLYADAECAHIVYDRIETDQVVEKKRIGGLQTRRLFARTLVGRCVCGRSRIDRA